MAQVPVPVPVTVTQVLAGSRVLARHSPENFTEFKNSLTAHQLDETASYLGASGNCPSARENGPRLVGLLAIDPPLPPENLSGLSKIAREPENLRTRELQVKCVLNHAISS
jgi:hypothetical protein